MATTQAQPNGALVRFFPFLGWVRGYSPARLRSDLVAGATVGLVLIPQSMAYAQLAGLPPYYGLFAAFLPPMVASLFGSSQQLATGPVAMVSLMTATALEPYATAGSEGYIAYALLLAFMVGVFQLLLGTLKLGMIVNFLSHPVVNGFTNAAAFIIASSQLPQIFGVQVDNAEHYYQTIVNVVKAAWACTHWPTFGLAALSFAIMAGLKRFRPRVPNVLVVVVLTTILSWAAGFEDNLATTVERLDSARTRQVVADYNGALDEVDRLSAERVGLSARIQEAKKTHGPSAGLMTLRHELDLLNLGIKEHKESSAASRALLREMRFERIEEPSGDRRTWRLKVGNSALKEDSLTLMAGGAVVGRIPEGLPRLKAPKFDLNIMLSLFPMVVIISMLGFMEAISIAKSMAARTGQRLDPDQELIGQGLANMAGSVTQGYPVSGSFSRSAVNLSAGGVTGLSNVFSAVLVAVVMLFFTPLLYHLPQAVLASIIMMAVIGLLNIRGFLHAWHAQKHDGVITLVTFAATLVFAPHLDRGISLGVILSLGFYLLRTTKPDIAILSKYTDGAYRNAERLGLAQCRRIAVIRCNSSLFFASVNYLEDAILERVASMPELKHVHIVGNGINELDATGEDMLSSIVARIREAGYGISISGLNESVLDVMRRTGLHDRIGEEHIFRSVASALENIHARNHADSDEDPCPLAQPVFKGLPVSAGAMRKIEGIERRKEAG